MDLESRREVITVGRFVPDDPESYSKEYKETVWHAGKVVRGYPDDALQVQRLHGILHIEDGYVRFQNRIIPNQSEGLGITVKHGDNLHPGLYVPYKRAEHNFYNITLP